MIGWLLFFAGWTVLGFAIWVTLTGSRSPITPADIKAMREEAERAASMAEANCAWPIAAERDRASFHNASVTTR